MRFGGSAALKMVTPPPSGDSTPRFDIARLEGYDEAIRLEAEALFAGADGLDDYRRIIPDLPRLLAPGGAAILEIGHQQRISVSQLAEAAERGEAVLVTETALRCLLGSGQQALGQGEAGAGVLLADGRGGDGQGEQAAAVAILSQETGCGAQLSLNQASKQGRRPEARRQSHGMCSSTCGPKHASPAPT